MNYYPFHPGDYLRDTAHLDPMEDITYRRLLDMYYQSEKPIPLETDLVSRRLRLGSDSVLPILKEFFQETPEGWRHRRCDAEIADYNARSERARENGKAGGRPKKTQPVISGLAKETQGKTNQNQNQNQNQKEEPTQTLPATAAQRLGVGEDSSDALKLAAEPEPLPQKPAKNLPTSPQAQRIATMFKRRLSTPWQSREVSALRNLGTIEEADLAAVEAYYSAHWPPDRNKNVLRHDLGTLLNNFRGEVDRAHNWQRKSAPPAADAPRRDFWARSALAEKPKTQTTP